MPIHLKALVVILAIAIVVFWIAKRPLCEFAMDEADFKRRRNVWFAVTLIAFLTPNFWFYALFAGIVLAIAASRERNPMALFFLMLFAVPPFRDRIPGFGLINYVFELDYYRLLALTILLPAGYRLMQRRPEPHVGLQTADRFFAGYVGLLVVLTFLASSMTNTLRQVFLMLIDMVLPYFVASRSMRQLRDFKEAAACFVLAAVLLAGAAVFETVRHWLLYSSLAEAMGLSWEGGLYLSRGDETGPLRALGSTAHSIVLGYMMVVALGLFVYLSGSLRVRIVRWLAWIALVAGLVATFSRGPLLGGAVGLVVGLGLGSKGPKRLAQFFVCGGIVFACLLLTPWSDAVIDYLPFFGSGGVESVTYRQRLFEVSISVLLQNPFFGAFDSLLNSALEELRQGQGIIDLVNSYIGVALSTGFIGLTLFVGIFFTAAISVLRARRYVMIVDPDGEALGRSLLATLAGIMITIATASNVNAISLVYWTVAGLCVAYVRVIISEQGSQDVPMPVGRGFTAARAHAGL